MYEISVMSAEGFGISEFLPHLNNMPITDPACYSAPASRENNLSETQITIKYDQTNAAQKGQLV
ncbi:MAG: hypothetical protein CMK07_06255 [Ponticaulis sp.]|nr:hypothetical protein [Ponticaulis sp.]